MFHLKAGDGAFSRLFQGFVDPRHDGVINYLLSIAQVLQDVQGVPEAEFSSRQYLSIYWP